jgi:hypothetical protein
MSREFVAESAVKKLMLKGGRKPRGAHVFLEQLEAMTPENLVKKLDSTADASALQDENALLRAGDMGIWGELYKRNLRLLFEASQALVEGFSNAQQITATDAAAEPLHIADTKGGTESILPVLWKLGPSSR